MLKTVELDTDKAGKYSWFAQQDAMRRNENNKSFYTEKQVRQALTARDLLDNAYAYSGKIEINYRKSFITVKLADAKVKNRAMLREIEQIFEEQGVIKVLTKQAVIYRLTF